MGETAAKLRLVFDQIAATRGVYLFDEFDAIGARRGGAHDVGEMRRVLNSFLAFMEESNSTDSVVVAATNHPDSLDHALARRFDEVIEYPLPDPQAARELMTRRLGKFVPRDLDWASLQIHTEGLSQGEIVRAVDEVVKDIILEDRLVDAPILIESLKARHAYRSRFRTTCIMPKRIGSSDSSNRDSWTSHDRQFC